MALKQNSFFFPTSDSEHQVAEEQQQQEVIEKGFIMESLMQKVTT